MFLKEFEIRWNDLDANRHLANATYLKYAAHTRMSLLTSLGFTQQLMGKLQIGPVVFYEHMYYFKEVFFGQKIKVSLDWSGQSDDGMFFEFTHNYYNREGKNFARCELMGGWMDLINRKLIALPHELMGKIDAVEKPVNFRVLTRDDTRKYGRKPTHLN